MIFEPRPVLALGALAAGAGTSTITAAAPGSGATVTIWNSTTNSTAYAGSKYRRLILAVYSSHASGSGGVIFEGSMDGGTNWDLSETYTLSATTATIYNYSVRTPHVRIRYTNSSNVLTSWRLSLLGDESSADAGA